MIDAANQLCVFVIYENPADMPEPCFVVRRWITRADDTEAHADIMAVVASTLDAARAAVPPGLFRLERTDDDDACIVEVWL